MTTTTFPSGLVADLRKIKGSEMAALAEQAEGQGRADPFSTLLSSCWLATMEPGPYPFVITGESKPETKRLLKGDLLYGFISLRRMSLPDGDAYDFDAQCEQCRARIPWTIDLQRDLTIKVLPEDSVKQVRSGQPFETFVDDDHGSRKLKFNLGYLHQEEDITRFMKQMKRTKATMIDTLASQVASIEGITPEFRAHHRYLTDLGMGQLLELQERIAAPDCGVDTKVEIQCQKCRWEQETALPFGRTFFALRKRGEASPAAPPA